MLAHCHALPPIFVLRLQLEMLQYLVTVAKGPAQRFEVLGQLVSSLFDSNPSLNSHLKTSVWKKCVINLLEMMKILQENPHIKVSTWQSLSAAAAAAAHTHACIHALTHKCTCLQA
eukprot:scaffold76946_cov19-Tisochrysis_lutea.AAC.1